MKYRIISKQKFLNGLVPDGNKSVYAVQKKYNLFPFWLTSTDYFNTEEQAKNHIKLITEVSK